MDVISFFFGILIGKSDGREEGAPIPSIASASADNMFLFLTYTGLCLIVCCMIAFVLLPSSWIQDSGDFVHPNVCSTHISALCLDFLV